MTNDQHDPYDEVGVDWAKSPTHRPPEHYPEPWQQDIYDMPTDHQPMNGAVLAWAAIGAFFVWVSIVSWVCIKYL